MKLSRCLACVMLLSALPATAFSQVQRAKLTASDMGQGDRFGQSVSLSGDTALIGSPYDDDVADESGAAYVFQRNGSSWVQVQKLKASDAEFGDEFSRSVAISGDVAVIGAPHDTANGVFDTGSAYLFERIAGTWTQTAKLVASDAAPTAHFGYSVATSGTRLVVGARDDTEHGTGAGAAYVFDKVGASWLEMAKLVGSDVDAFDSFGGTVAVSADLVLVGSSSDEGPAGSFSGSAYVFEKTPTGWSQMQKLVASDAAPSAYFGWSVALDGNTALIGANVDNAAGSYSGAAYAFELQTTTWVQTQKINANDAAADDTFGTSVALSGDVAIVGAHQDDDSGGQSGSAYAFRRTGSSWAQVGKLLALDGSWQNLFGASVGLSGDRVLVGAWGDDDACPGNPGSCASGSAYVFQLAPDAGQYCSCGAGAPCNNIDTHGGCASQAGRGAVLAAGASGSVAADDLELHITWLPPNKAGLLFMSDGQSFLPLFNGIRCVGGGGANLFRYPFRNGGPQGIIVHGPGLVAWSQTHFTPSGQIAAGQTWYFQSWYRDPFGPCGQTSNFSNAVQVVFRP